MEVVRNSTDVVKDAGDMNDASVPLDGKSVTFKVTQKRKDQVDPKPEMKVVNGDEQQPPIDI